MFVAIDGGGTKSRVLITNEDGVVLSYFEGPGLNINVLGNKSFEENIKQVIWRISKDFDIEDHLFCFGLAGASKNEEKISGILKRIGVKKFKVLTDIEATFLALGGGDDCIIVSSGTGSFAYGQRENLKYRAGGWGYLFDDEGSGYWVGRKALKYAFMSIDGRIGKTILVKRLEELFQVDSLEKAIPLIYSEYKLPRKTAELALIVKKSAEEGDNISLLILKEAAQELFKLVDTVACNLKLTKEDSFHVYGTGGFLSNVKCVEDILREKILKKYPCFIFEIRNIPSIIGSLLMCYKVKFNRIDKDFLKKVIQGYKQMKK
ncbi:MAG: hypothetical protein B6U94_01215 [Thermofilum sp. ex4484_79]|nr:MAG: hypothetical protein B6U94_01215 [Thermofilum sp. ex4484_79]